MFSETVALNVPFALRIMASVYLGIGVLGACLMKPPKQKLVQE